MKKLRLNLDTLRVESFSTDRADHPGGTVRGYDYTSDCPSEMAGCTANVYCDGSSGCGAWTTTTGPVPTMFSCDVTCQNEN
ncbi:MAG TPA: hypothetical protein VGC13_05205 [Longimicrobium sp.]|jgi:hypothetical protein